MTVVLFVAIILLLVGLIPTNADELAPPRARKLAIENFLPFAAAATGLLIGALV